MGLYDNYKVTITYKRGLSGPYVVIFKNPHTAHNWIKENDITIIRIDYE